MSVPIADAIAARDQHARTPTPSSDPTSPRTGALSEEQPRICAACRAERAQDADLRSPLRHRDRERVVDDEHPDEEREHARDVHHHRVAGEHRFELLAAARRRLDLEAGTEQRVRAPARRRRAVTPRREREVDAIERAAAPEHLLRGVDVHDREVAAEGARQPDGFMMPRIVNCFSPSAVPSDRRLPIARPFLSANSFERMSESGCARKTSGSSTTASSPLSRS